jgi:hypothetical protein
LLDPVRLGCLDIALHLFRQPIEKRGVPDVWKDVPFVGDIASLIANDVSAFTAELAHATDPHCGSLRLAYSIASRWTRKRRFVTFGRRGVR